MKVIILYCTPGLLAVVFLNITDISLDLTLDILSVGLGGAGWLAGPTINKSCPIHQQYCQLRMLLLVTGICFKFYSRYGEDDNKIIVAAGHQE